MGDSTGLLTQEGRRVRVPVDRDGDGLFVERADGERIRLSLLGDSSVAHVPSGTTSLLTVQKYCYGVGGEPDRLYAKLADDTAGGRDADSSDEEVRADAAADSTDSSSSSSGGSVEIVDRQIGELRGDGERIQTTVWVAEAYDVESESVLQWGRLADQSSDELYSFIVFDGTDVERLQQGTRYRLTWVGDNYYEAKDRHQVVLDQYSTVEALDSSGEPPASMRESARTSTTSGVPRRQIDGFCGDGERIETTVWVTEQSGAKSEAVLQWGRLADQSSDELYQFVVFDGPGVERLQPRKRYRLAWVRDGYYEAKDRYQVVVDQYSTVEALDSSGELPNSFVTTTHDDGLPTYEEMAAEHLEHGLDPDETLEDAMGYGHPPR